MTYDDQMDPECIPLCDALNECPGIETTSSCCGHGKEPFRIWFDVKDLDALRPLLSVLYPGLHWDWRVTVDLSDAAISNKFYFCLEAKAVSPHPGADTIAKHLREELATV